MPHPKRNRHIFMNPTGKEAESKGCQGTHEGTLGDAWRRVGKRFYHSSDSEFRIILRQDGDKSRSGMEPYGHISNWMGAAIQLARKWHERAREGTSRLLALLCVADSEKEEHIFKKVSRICCGVGLPGISEFICNTLHESMNPNGRNQQSTEHERL